MDDEAMDDDESFFAPQPTVCTGPHRLPSPNAAGGIAEESDAEAPETNHAPTTVTMPRVSSCNPESQPIEPTSHPGDRLEDNRFTDYGYRSSSTPTTTLSPLLPSTSHRQLHLRATLLDEGVMPPPAAVRFEEFINWFDLRLRRSEPRPRSHRRRRPSPFDEDNLLVRVGVQAEQIADNERPPVSLTFIVDTSGSMDRDDRLGLVRESLPHPRRTNSTTTDTVAIVGLLPTTPARCSKPTAVRNERDIPRRHRLAPPRRFNQPGIRACVRATHWPQKHSVPTASTESSSPATASPTAGITDPGSNCSRFIRGYADEGIQLDEVERLFEDELTSTLITAAIDAKIQVEFDSDIVDEYRLIGFENRGVRDSDFRNDAVDAAWTIRGDIGEVFLRWEDPQTGEVIEIDEDIDLRDVEENWSDTSIDFQLATVVTAFGEVMRDNPYADDVNLSNIHVEAGRVADQR
ncbi:hypothetical protein GQR58_030080 [Nymphon striatum]|nr:hypothetical protein GQR58_030080 [Nymphon striatum]